MTKRLIFAILGTTIAALLLAGLGTLAISRNRTRNSTEKDLRREVVALADGLSTQTGAADANAARPAAILAVVRRVLHLEGFEVLTVRNGKVTTGALPKGLTATDVPAETMAVGQVLSGKTRNIVYAAAAADLPVQKAKAVFVVTRKPASSTWPIGWFLWASAVTVVLGALVAAALGKRLTKPVREADAVARRLAAGELSARLPEPPASETDELADLARSINAMATHLERSQGLEQQFLMSVSHDLRTPLTSIRGYAEAITDGATKDPAWAAGVILTESRRLERLVRDLLDLAKLQANGFSLDLRPTDLAALAAEGLEGFGPDAARSGVRLVAQAGGSVMANVDRDRTAQVLANLVENAMKYARTTVTVGAVALGGVALVWVDDDGPGIPPADQPHVFERLYVARQEPMRKESGSGLGLAIVRELVVAMGGTVAAESAPSGGARMVVRFRLVT